MKVKIEGNWPGVITLRRGAAWAESRPWNADIAFARLRMERGGPVFLGDCADTLSALGAEGVLSPPLSRAAQDLWKQADFVHHARLRVFRLELDDIEVLTSHLIGQLMELYRRIDEHEGVLRLCGLSPENRAAICAAHLDELLTLYNDRQEALLGRPCPLKPR